MEFSQLPLREQKYARTKVGLLTHAVDMLSSTSLDDLSIKELCRRAEVSEATFYNYFPHKCELLKYFVQLWTLEMMWLSKNKWETTGIEHINNVFEYTSATSVQDSYMMGEIIVLLARIGMTPPTGEVTLAERLLIFPDCPGVDDLPTNGFDSVILPAVEEAFRQGDIPANAGVETVVMGLIALFFGMPISLYKQKLAPAAYVDMMMTQLDIFWRGLGATRGVSATRLFVFDESERAIPQFGQADTVYPMFLSDFLDCRTTNR